MRKIWGRRRHHKGGKNSISCPGNGKAEGVGGVVSEMVQCGDTVD